MCSSDEANQSYVNIGVFGGLLLIFYPLAYFFYKNVRAQQVPKTGSAKEKKVRQYLKWVSVVAFCAYGSCLHFGVISSILECTNTPYFLWLSIFVLSMVSYIGGQFCVLILFMLRLKVLFSSTLKAFGYSDRTFKILYICFGITTFDYVIFVSLFFIINDKPDIYGVFFVAFLILYVGTYISVVILLWRRIPVIIAIMSVGVIEQESKDDTPLVDINATNLLVRYLLLAMVGFVSTLSTFTVVGYVFTTILSQAELWEFHYSMVSAGVDSLINSICLCCLFQFSTNFYYNLCLLLDSLLKWVFTSFTFKQTQVHSSKREYARTLFGTPELSANLKAVYP